VANFHTFYKLRHLLNVRRKPDSETVKKAKNEVYCDTNLAYLGRGISRLNFVSVFCGETQPQRSVNQLITGIASLLQDAA
jgi:hypothetical protein